MVLLRILLRQLEFFALKRSAYIYWVLLGLFSLTAFISGLIGWWHWRLDNGAAIYIPRGEAEQNYYAVIETVQLAVKAVLASDLYAVTTLEEMPRSLQIARVSGSLSFVLIVGRIFIFAMSGKASRLFLWARCNHDIVVGDHEIACEHAKTSKYNVTHLRARSRSAEEFEMSDSLDVDLRAIGASRSYRLVVAYETDIETWTEAQKIAALYPHKEVLAHISDPWLLERVGKAEPATRLKPFSFISGVARQVMLAHPPYLLARCKNSNAQHIVVVGFSDLGQALVQEFLITSVSNAPAAMAVTIIDSDAKTKAAAFRARHPGIESVIDFTFIAGDLGLKSPHIEDVFKQRCEKFPVAAIYVCLEQHKHPLANAVAIKDRSEREKWFDAPIFVNTIDGGGLNQVKHGTGSYGQPEKLKSPNLISELKLVPFGSWQNGVDGTPLSSDNFDDLPERFHHTYVETTESSSLKKDISKDWDYLEEELRVANRRVSAHIRATLDAAGFDLNQWLENGDSKSLPYSCSTIPKKSNIIDIKDEEEIETLARLQHRRWMLDRMLNGWSYAAVRDNIARKHNCLVEYDDLDDKTKEYDRAMVRQIAKIIRT